MTKTAAEKLLKYMERKDHPVVVTEKKIKQWWHIINEAVFKNELYLPEIETRKLRRMWGYCALTDDDDVVIVISESIITRDLFIGTLAHEIVHQWQYQCKGKMNHASTYIKWKKYFKKNFEIIL